MQFLFKVSFLSLLTTLIGFIPAEMMLANHFQGLGDLPGGGFLSGANGVSADGKTVVGFGISENGLEAFKWDLVNGMVALGVRPEGSYSSRAYEVSENGETIVGLISHENGYTTFKWDAVNGIVLLNEANSLFYNVGVGISADGSTVVGSRANMNGGEIEFTEAYVWDSSNSEVGLGHILPNSYISQAFGVSADGSRVVGVSFFSGRREAFIWDEEKGMVGLGYLPGVKFASWDRYIDPTHAEGSTAYGISSDSSTVVGQSNSANGFEAFVWNENDGMVGLGDLPGKEDFYSIAHAVSADGSVVVGTSILGKRVQFSEAFIWDKDRGMRSLKSVLENKYDLDLTGWQLQTADDISDDGLTIRPLA